MFGSASKLSKFRLFEAADDLTA